MTKTVTAVAHEIAKRFLTALILAFVAITVPGPVQAVIAYGPQTGWHQYGANAREVFVGIYAGLAGIIS